MMNRLNWDDTRLLLALARHGTRRGAVSEFLLDTNVVSELRKGSRADPGVIDFVDRHPADSFWLSVIVKSRWE